MITTIVLHHPQSSKLITNQDLEKTERYRISCGTTKDDDADFSEANDFHPTYASWNSSLFETSVILTAWEHADQLIKNNNVAILHTDITPHFEPDIIWKQIDDWIVEDNNRAIGLVVPAATNGVFTDIVVPKHVKWVPKHDPMNIHCFDHDIYIWDYIKKLDKSIYEWAFDIQPRLIYSHQFACSRQTFDWLGDRLYRIASMLRLSSIGLWTPHVFERLIALYLAKISDNKQILSTCFWHASSSSVAGPGQFSLYGPRPVKYYKLRTRFNVDKV